MLFAVIVLWLVATAALWTGAAVLYERTRHARRQGWGFIAAAVACGGVAVVLLLD